MTTLTESSRGAPGPVGRRPGRGWRVAGVGFTCVAVVALLVAHTGPGTALARRPDPGSYHYGGAWRANRPLWGFDHWIVVLQILSVVGSGTVMATFAYLSWRRHAMHPVIPVVIALALVSLMDPFANWTSSAAMNPALLHYPTGWPYLRISPTVQPLVNNLVYPYLFLGPALVVLAFWRRRASWTSHVSGWPDRHPLLTVFGLAYVISLPINLVIVDLFMVRVEYWTYTQMPSWVAIRAGSSWQFPWTDPLTLSVVTGATAVFLCRDDAGRSPANRLADRVAWLRSRRLLGEILIAGAFLALSYMAYNGVWASFRMTNSAHTIAQPWPYQDTRVYDPQGAYRAVGVRGPYTRDT